MLVSVKRNLTGGKLKNISCFSTLTSLAAAPRPLALLEGKLFRSVFELSQIIITPTFTSVSFEIHIYFILCKSFKFWFQIGHRFDFSSDEERIDISQKYI